MRGAHDVAPLGFDARRVVGDGKLIGTLGDSMRVLPMTTDAASARETSSMAASKTACGGNAMRSRYVAVPVTLDAAGGTPVAHPARMPALNSHRAQRRSRAPMNVTMFASSGMCKLPERPMSVSAMTALRALAADRTYTAAPKVDPACLIRERSRASRA